MSTSFNTVQVVLRKAFGLLTSRERRRVSWLVLSLVITALLEVAGIASIMPFLTLAANPESFQQHGLLAWLYTTFQFQSQGAFLFFVGSLVLAVLTLGNGFAAFSMNFLYRFTWMQNHRLSLRLLESYLNKPYTFFLENNTAHLGKNMIAEVQEVISSIFVTSMKLVAKLCVAFFVLLLLLTVNPILALTVLGVLGGAYAILYSVLRRKLKRIGEARIAANASRFRLANEALSSIKDVRVLGREHIFLDRYAQHSAQYARQTATRRLIAELPRYALELITFGGILLIVLYLLGTGQDIRQLLPLLGLYAFASYRLVPALQQIFEAFADISASAASLELLYHDLQTAPLPAAKKDVRKLPFQQGLRVQGATLHYKEAKEASLKGVSLELRPHTITALVGATGSGKTTLLDVILGLLPLEKGNLTVDGVPLDETTLPGWRKLLGYVPQKMYLSDDTVLNNIAFGVAPHEIDKAAAEHAAKLAQLHDFIENDLPQGYHTPIGERGTRLSGGQQQRLGIARALYRQPDILILDEATSALDPVTERTILQALKTFAPQQTVLMVTHRISTTRYCDTIYFLERGQLIGHGTYDSLLETSPKFRAMTRLDTQHPSTQVTP